MTLMRPTNEADCRMMRLIIIIINERPLNPKSMPPTGDEQAKLKAAAPNKRNSKRKKERKTWNEIKHCWMMRLMWGMTPPPPAPSLTLQVLRGLLTEPCRRGHPCQRGLREGGREVRLAVLHGLGVHLVRMLRGRLRRLHVAVVRQERQVGLQLQAAPTLHYSYSAGNNNNRYIA